MAAYELLLLNTAVPQIQAAQSGDTYVVPRDIAFSAALTLSAGTANGVPYLNASKVLTTGSALTFDGTDIRMPNGGSILVGASASGASLIAINGTAAAQRIVLGTSGTDGVINVTRTSGVTPNLIFQQESGELMRLTSTGLGIGTNNPAQKLDVNGDASIYGVTVGRGAGAVATNTAVGASALAANTTGANNTATGNQALVSNRTGDSNSAFGYFALRGNTTGTVNTAVALGALQQNTTGAANTAIGTQALTSNTTASNNTAVGYQALYASTPPVVTAGAFVVSTSYTIVTVGTTDFVAIGASANTVGVVFTATGAGSGTGTASTNVNAFNTAIGYGSGSAITTGTKHSILGAYTGNQGGLDIRTASNYIVLSDGDGNPRAYSNEFGQWTFPAVNGAIRVGGSGYVTNPSTMVLGQYTSTRVYVQAPAGGAVEIWDDGTNPIAIFNDDRTITAAYTIGVGGTAGSTSGAGITFPATQSASSNANTLDDYEEGTWTATLTDGTNTTTSDGATYRKIGSLVFLSFQFYDKDISAWNAANLSVTGLPFTVATNHDSFVTVGTPNGFTVSGPLAMGFSNGATSSGLYYRGGGANWTGVQKGDITNNSDFSLYLSACYTAS